MKPFKLFVEQRSTFSIGLFPGAFKPPHKGHYDTVIKALKENNEVYVLVSNVDRDGISSSKSIQIWNVYNQYIKNDKLKIVLVSGSPVTLIYQIIDILNNGAFSPTPRSPSPMPEAVKVAEEIKTRAGMFNINLYAGKEDIARYNAFFDQAKTTIYKGKNVKNINLRDVSRLTSSSAVRAALKEKNYLKFKDHLPGITKEDKQNIYTILLK